MSFIFVLISLALLPVFVSILKRFPVWVSFVFFFVVILESIFVAFYTLINFGGAFGPGVLLFCVSAIFIPVVFVALITIGVRQFPQLSNLQKVVFAVGGVIILVAQSSPVIGDYGIGGYCDEKIMEHGNTLITTIEQYRNANGNYPSEIESLVPKYLSSKPTYNCMGNLGLNYDSLIAHYGIKECDDKPSLVTYSTNGVRVMWYDFEMGKWSSISFLDSDCY